MNDCRNIEPLIYLYRDGELTDEERSVVLEHTKACKSCSEVLRQLQSMDEALSPLREELPVLSEEVSLVNDTIDVIAGKKGEKHSRVKKASPMDGLIRWLQPSLGFALVAAIVLFIIQQSRDAMKIADLENNLRANGNTVMAGESFTNSVAQQLTDLMAAGQKRRNAFSSSPQSASAFADPGKLISSGLIDLLRHNSSLFDQFSRKYPDLASVNPDDGIDEREQKILDTEGRAFIRDFEQLLHEAKK